MEKEEQRSYWGRLSERSEGMIILGVVTACNATSALHCLVAL